MTHRPGPDFVRALAGHSVQTGPVSGIWSCIGPCGASSIDNVDGVPTTMVERQEQHRAHLAEVIEAELRASGVPVDLEVEWGVRVEHTYLDGYVSAVGSERAAIQHCAVREGQSMETTTTKLRRLVTPWEDVL